MRNTNVSTNIVNDMGDSFGIRKRLRCLNLLLDIFYILNLVTCQELPDVLVRLRIFRDCSEVVLPHLSWSIYKRRNSINQTQFSIKCAHIWSTHVEYLEFLLNFLVLYFKFILLDNSLAALFDWDFFSLSSWCLIYHVVCFKKIIFIL